jgi:hypothetical protein
LESKWSHFSIDNRLVAVQRNRKLGRCQGRLTGCAYHVQVAGN